MKTGGFMETKLSLDGPARYHICLQGRLDEKWSAYFNGMSMTVEYPESGPARTELCGMVQDQAALHGILNHIRDLNLPLILVEWQG
jgi:hypothetical protein